MVLSYRYTKEAQTSKFERNIRLYMHTISEEKIGQGSMSIICRERTDLTMSQFGTEKSFDIENKRQIHTDIEFYLVNFSAYAINMLRNE